jgi:hypothetical protein
MFRVPATLVPLPAWNLLHVQTGTLDVIKSPSSRPYLGAFFARLNEINK